MVNTVEVSKMQYFADLLIKNKKPFMLVGPSGSGKTLLMSDKLSCLSDHNYGVANISLNYYTTSGKSDSSKPNKRAEKSRVSSLRNARVTEFYNRLIFISETLQKFMDKSLEKKAGRNFGPIANKTMIYFIDDLNIPKVFCPYI